MNAAFTSSARAAEFGWSSITWCISSIWLRMMGRKSRLPKSDRLSYVSAIKKPISARLWKTADKTASSEFSAKVRVLCSLRSKPSINLMPIRYISLSEKEILQPDLMSRRLLYGECERQTATISSEPQAGFNKGIQPCSRISFEAENGLTYAIPSCCPAKVSASSSEFPGILRRIGQFISRRTKSPSRYQVPKFEGE